MAHARLRVYYGPETRFASTADATKPAADENHVTVPLGEILPMLADAVANKRTWLGDFAADEVTISTDLYEVILAYQHCRRPVA